MKIIFPLFVLLFFLAGCHPGNNRSSGRQSADSITTPAADTPGSKPVPDSIAGKTVPPDRLIEAGRRVGKTFLGEETGVLAKTLGKPDLSDAAMGKAWLTWYGKKRDEHNNRTELNIYTTYKDSNMTSKVVKQIRTTSSWFVVKDSLHVYSGFREIRQAFPDLAYTGKYQDEGREIAVYDDADRGIAFEIVTANGQQLCTGIIVHEPGKQLGNTYIPLHEKGGR